LPHSTPLITTIVAGLSLAFAFGFLAHRLKIPALAGYLLAGVLIGPFTPGFVADQELANELAEIGVILLMFGVGLHFSLKDLLAVRAIALPGAIGQMAAATFIGIILAWAMDWSLGAGLVFGLALSVASTVVLLRALQERRILETERGRIAVGWLIVEDIVMVLTLVLLPPLAGLLGGQAPAQTPDPGFYTWLGAGTIWGILAITLAKIAAFITLMLVIGRKLIPWILHHVAHSGSRELFRLAVLVLALGVAFGSAQLFGVSFALGAFFAGMVMAETTLSTQAARETLPLRDAFAVLFFVSVGMLFNPAILVENSVAVAATFLTIVVGKSAAAYFIMRAFGYPKLAGLTIAASLAQIGEFSFILIVLGLKLSIVPENARDLVVAGALLSILFNPFLFYLLDRYGAPAEQEEATAQTETDKTEEETPSTLEKHVILVGHGRVGSRISDALLKEGIVSLVIDEEQSVLDALAERGVETYHGSAGERLLLDRINLPAASMLISAIPDAFEAGSLIEHARTVNPSIRIIARAHSPEAVAYLRSMGADAVIVGEDELALGIIREVLKSSGEVMTS
jgi:CPA2 family monovalent cation:H+ antiporter-2